MKNNPIFYEKNVCKKSFIDVSICKSNIKEETYYAKPCKNGFVKSCELLSMLKRRAPYVDETVMSAACEELSNIIVSLISVGKTVEFFSLGSFSLATKGKVEVEASEQSYLQDESVDITKQEAKKIEDITSGGYNLDVSSIIKTKPTFILKFEQSQLVKKTLENMEVNVAIKKKRAPTVAQITNVVSKYSNKAKGNLPTILRIKGEDLKIVSHAETKEGDVLHVLKEKQMKQTSFEHGNSKPAELVSVAGQVGVYIEESGSGMMKKLPNENIIKNTPKELMVILDEKLEDGAMYNLVIATQYVKMGKRRVGHILRSTKIEFNTNEIEKEKASSRLQHTLAPIGRATVLLEKMPEASINLRLKKWKNSRAKNALFCSSAKIMSKLE